jgi:general secretion pathway protein J
MNRRRQHVQRRQGFTLLEVLLALAVVAVVLSAISAVFFGALRLHNRTVERFARAVPIEQAITIIRRDLQGIVPPGGQLAGEFQTNPTTNTMLATSGTRVSPDFYTASAQIDEQTPYSELQRVAFFLQPPTNQSPGFDLVRNVARDLLPVNEAQFDHQLVLSGVQNVLLQYFDGSAWQDQWDSTVTSNLPVAIRMQIQMQPEEIQQLNQAPVIEILARVMTDVLTNRIASATAQGGVQ